MLKYLFLIGGVFFWASCGLFQSENDLVCGNIIYQGGISTSSDKSSQINVEVILDDSLCGRYATFDTFQLYWYETEAGYSQRNLPDAVFRDGREFLITSAPLGVNIIVGANFTDTVFTGECMYSIGKADQIVTGSSEQFVTLDLRSAIFEGVCS